jgi:hypothetical protein
MGRAGGDFAAASPRYLLPKLLNIQALIAWIGHSR